MNNKPGILITNIGSPDTPTPKAIRAYLKKFLSDSRVVEIPKLLWYPILYGLILPFRSNSSAKLYQKIWTEHGSPLTIQSLQLAQQLQQELNIPVEIGMHYGKPFIHEGLEKLRAQGVNKIIVLPLFPQYSATSTASSFDFVTSTLKSWRDIPEISFHHDYHDHPAYIQAIASSIQDFWVNHPKPQYLLFSFHSIPERYSSLGDPYYSQCIRSAELIAEQLHLDKTMWSLSFQSRLGKAKWLSPYTDKVLQDLPQQGIKDIHVVCPGFAIDCLETLEEISMRGKQQFVSAGGNSFSYIPALNYSSNHIELIKKILSRVSI